MAREMNKKPKRFVLEKSDAIEENERILEAGSQQRRENRENNEKREAEQAVEQAPTAHTSSPVPTSTPVAQEPIHTEETPTNRFSLQGLGKKTANGIVVNVPMEDYMQLTMMKCQTGRTLKDLALQAIHEFIERNK